MFTAKQSLIFCHSRQKNKDNNILNKNVFGEVYFPYVYADIIIFMFGINILLHIKSSDLR